MLTQIAKVAAASQGARPVQGLDEVALEEVGAGGEGDPVGYGCAEGGGGVGEEVKGL